MNKRLFGSEKMIIVVFLRGIFELEAQPVQTAARSLSTGQCHWF